MKGLHICTSYFMLFVSKAKQQQRIEACDKSGSTEKDKSIPGIDISPFFLIYSKIMCICNGEAGETGDIVDTGGDFGRFDGGGLGNF